MRGRLLHLEAVPRSEIPYKVFRSPAWPGVFSAAGLESAGFRSADSEWMPLAWGDSRAAWTGTLPGRPDLPVRIEAAAYRGKQFISTLFIPGAHPSAPPKSSHAASGHRHAHTVDSDAVHSDGRHTCRPLERPSTTRRSQRSHSAGAFGFVVFLAMWPCALITSPIFRRYFYFSWLRVGRFSTPFLWSFFICA